MIGNTNAIIGGAEPDYTDTLALLDRLEDAVGEYVLEPEEEYFLTFSSPNSFTLSVVDNKKHWDGTLEYSTDKTSWNTWVVTHIISSSNDGKLYIRGVGNTYITGVSASSSNGAWRLNGSNISVSGNIENLLDYATVELGNHPAMGSGAFKVLFAYPTSTPNGNITDISGLVLGAETLTIECYRGMFQANTGITTSPSGLLPARTLADNCYYNMFNRCTHLTTAPALPATTLAANCYQSMFYGCISLTTAPALPATTLANACYFEMFLGCAGLTTAPALPATTLATQCYESMFNGCGSLYVSDTQTAEASKVWRIPTNAVISGATYFQGYMFANCLGTRVSNHFAGTNGQQFTYYTQNEPV